MTEKFSVLAVWEMQLHSYNNLCNAAALPIINFIRNFNLVITSQELEKKGEKEIKNIFGRKILPKPPLEPQ